MRLITTLALAIAAGMAGSASAQSQPNIIVIMSDDAGYNEFGFSSSLVNGNTQFQTPNIDALANQSVVLRQGYSAAPLCSPSRAGMLTGQYQQRTGFEENLGNDLVQPWGFKGNETLLSDRLKSLGYTTGLVGKWHNGYISGVNRPNDMGYDEFFGFLSGARQYFTEGAPSNLMLRNNTIVESQWRTQGNPALYDPVRGRYVTDAFSEEAVDFINRHANDPNPFYLHVAYTAPHTPLTAKAQDLALFSHIADPNVRTMAAMTYAMDRGVGSILNALTANGLDQETIIVFMSDHGGSFLNDNASLRGFKGYTWEGGIRTPMAIRAPGLTPTIYNAPVSMYDLVPTLVAAAGGAVPAAETAGVNIMPFLSGAQSGNPHETLFWRQQEIWAIRKGDWKLARPNEPNISVLSLYNLVADPAELVNRVNQEPALVAELTREFTRWEATLDKPDHGPLGANDKNNFDHFVFRNFVGAVNNWSAPEAWMQGGTFTLKTMLPSDAYANAILEFTTRNDANYTATNNMTRMTKLTYMLNEFRFTGNFASTDGRSGTLNGNAVLMVKNLAGQAPRIRLDATAVPGAATFAFHLSNEIQLLDDLEIVGDGTQSFVINGVIKDYFEPRGVTKTGSSVLTLTAGNTFGGPLAVNGGHVRIVGPSAAVSNASTVTVAAPGRLTLSGGLIRTGSITLAPGAQFQFESGVVELTGSGTDLGTGPFDVGATGPATLTLLAGASASSPTLQIGANFNSQLNLAPGATLTTHGNATIALNNAGAPTGSSATISGPGALWTISGDLAVGQRGRASLTVVNGGQVLAHGAATLAAEAGSVATVVVGGGSSLSQLAAASIDVGGPAGGGAASLTVNPQGAVATQGPLAIRAAAAVTLAGGELSVGQLDNSHGGVFAWQSGKLRVTGPDGLVIAPGGPLGASLAVDVAHALDVVATATIGAGGALAVAADFSAGVVQIDGGTFAAPTLAGVGEVRFTHGMLTLNGGPSANAYVGFGGVTGAAGVPTVTLDAGKAWSIAGTTTLPYGSSLTVNGGSFQTGALHLIGGRFAAPSLMGIGSLDFDLGELAILGDVTIAASGPLGAAVDVGAGQTLDVGGNLFVGTAGSPGSLVIQPGGAVAVVGATTIAEMGSLTLAGGSLTTASLTKLPGGLFTWTSGHIAFTNGATIGAGGSLGASVALDPTKSLRVENGLIVAADGAVTLDGGALSVGDLTRQPGGSFVWNSGQLEITGVQGLLIGAGGLLGDTVVLAAGDALAVAHEASIALGGSLTVAGGSFAAGTLDMLAGSFTAPDLSGVGQLSFTAGTMTLTGPAGITLGAGGTPLVGPVALQADDLLTVTGVTTLAAGASLQVNGGQFTSGGLTLAGGTFSAASLASVGPFTFQSGRLSLTQDLLVGPGGELGPAVTLHADQELHVDGTTTVAAMGSLSVSGGAFSTSVLKLDGGVASLADLAGVGAVDFLTGTLTVTGAAGATIGAGGVLPASLTINAARTLQVVGTTSLAAGGSLTVADGVFTTGALSLDGGSFAAVDLSPVQQLKFVAGSITLTGPGGVLFGAGGTALAGPMVLHAGDSLSVAGHTILSMGAALSVDGGTFTSGGLTLWGGSYTAPGLSGVGPVSFLDGALSLTQDNLTVGPAGPLGAALALSSSRSLHVAATTTIAASGSITVADGAFATGVLKLDGGTFQGEDLANVASVDFLAGAMTLTGSAGATIGSGGALPTSLTIDAARSLHIAASTNLAVGGSLTIANGSFTTGLLVLNGGTFTAASLAGVGAVDFHSGALTLTGPGGVTIGPGGPLGATVALAAGDSLHLGGTTSIIIGGELRVGLGATFTTDALVIHGGTFATTGLINPSAIQFNLGTLELIGDAAIAAGGGLQQVLGGQLVVGLGRRLTVGGTATLAAPTRVGGGQLSVGQLVNPELLDFDAGTLDLTATNLVVGAGGLFGPLLNVRTGTTLTVHPSTTIDAGALVEVQNYGDLASTTLVNNGEIVLEGLAATVETVGGLTNAGAMRGLGRVGGPVVNAAAGWVQTAGGERLRFLGPTFQNQGHASAIGTVVAPAELEFVGAVSNAASTGLITGAHARIRFDGGLANEGSLALTGGDNHIFGAIANDHEVVVTGGATATFYGDVTNHGVIRVSAAGATQSVAVFLGAVTGSGGTTGGGDIFFEGDLRPGETLAAATYGNDVFFGQHSTIEIDLAGTTPGAGYDQINVLGALQLGGTLAVSLQNGFTPQFGQAFNIITAAGGITGTFAHASLPSLADNLFWQVAYGPNAVSLVVAGQRPDFNADGRVDGLDFLVWQRNVGAMSSTGAPPGDANGDRTVNAADLAIWKSQFGATSPALAAASAVPEPAAAGLAAATCFALLVARRRRA